MRGPYALAFYCAAARTLLYCRDPFGRRSLVVKGTRVASAAPRDDGAGWAEVTTEGVHYVGGCAAWPRSFFDSVGWPPAGKPWREAGPADAAETLGSALAASVKRRCAGLSEVAVLFSGGLDSVVLARLAHDALPADATIDLINVAFGERRGDAEKAPGFFTVTGRGYDKTRIDARGRGRSTNDDEGGEEDGDASGEDETDETIEDTFAVAHSCVATDEDDESGVAAGGYLEALLLRALESLAALGVHPRDGWNVPLVVRAVREVDEGAARSAALACLAQIAKTAPDAVRDDVFDVGAALSDRAAAAADDVLSQRALESALVAVVPVWLEGGEPLVNVVSRLIDSLPRAPARRRAPVCAALVRAAPEGEALPAVVVTLLRRLKSLEAEARDRRTATEAVVDAEDAPVAAEEDAWVKELLDALLARETPMAATAALVAALKVRSRFVFRRSIAPFFSLSGREHAVFL